MNGVFLFAAYAMTHQGCGNLWQAIVSKTMRVRECRCRMSLLPVALKRF
uniref:Uncharacterized protein n=1 Tax=Anguilla anguilla TaxID=7936 RepID=A0A0E9VHN1_ANGAN